MIFDTHCHLGYGDQDAGETTARAEAASVSRLLCVGVDLASSRRARDFARALDPVDYAVGLHPNNADRAGSEWADLASMCRDEDCLAIGETGLDYYRDRTSPAAQKAALALHLELATELDLPVIIHCRDGFADIFDELAAWPRARGVFHCFSAGVREARLALDLGYYLSFAGPLTYPRSKDLRAAAAFASADRVLVETDAPFLPPQGRRGQTNEPAFIRSTLSTLAEVRGLSFDAAAELTMTNGIRLFDRNAPA